MLSSVLVIIIHISSLPQTVYKNGNIIRKIILTVYVPFFMLIAVLTVLQQGGTSYTSSVLLPVTGEGYIHLEILNPRIWSYISELLLHAYSSKHKILFTDLTFHIIIGLMYRSWFPLEGRRRTTKKKKRPPPKKNKKKQQQQFNKIKSKKFRSCLYSENIIEARVKALGMEKNIRVYEISSIHTVRLNCRCSAVESPLTHWPEPRGENHAHCRATIGSVTSQNQTCMAEFTC